MKKLIVKTALITLASLLAVFLLVLTAMTMYAPRTMATLLDGVGNRSLSLWYTEFAYQKFGEVDDLTNVFDKSVTAEDYERTIKYGNILIGREDFSDICASQDGVNVSYKNYVYGNTALAMYAEDYNDEEVLSFASATANGEYPDYNAYQMLLYSPLVSQDKAFLSALKDKLSALSQRVEDEDLQSDILYIDKILQDLT